MTLNSPIGSSLYFILLFIDLPPFSPVSCSEDTDYILSKCESNSYDAVIDSTDTVKSFLLAAMGHILCNDTVRIKKGTLG